MTDFLVCLSLSERPSACLLDYLPAYLPAYYLPAPSVLSVCLCRL